MIAFINGNPALVALALLAVGVAAAILCAALLYRRAERRQARVLGRLRHDSEQQSEAIIQINTGVDQISAVVATNTATAIGAASASEELSQQSLILKNMIAKFKLAENENSSYPDEDFDSFNGYGSNESILSQKVKELDDDDDVDLSELDISHSDLKAGEDAVKDELKIVLDDDDDKY